MSPCPAPVRCHCSGQQPAFVSIPMDITSSSLDGHRELGKGIYLLSLLFLQGPYCCTQDPQTQCKNSPRGKSRHKGKATGLVIPPFWPIWGTSGQILSPQAASELLAVFYSPSTHGRCSSHFTRSPGRCRAALREHRKPAMQAASGPAPGERAHWA